MSVFASVTYSGRDGFAKVAKPVEEVNAEIQRIVDDMFETMYAEEGISLAATQS